MSKEFSTGCPWELLYAKIIAETLEKLVEEFEMWKRNLERKRLYLKWVYESNALWKRLSKTHLVKFETAEDITNSIFAGRGQYPDYSKTI